MRGFLFRIGVGIKDFGEQMARVPVLWIFCNPVIKLGLAIKGTVLNMSVKGM
jgi:hypothetical protein